MNLWEETNDALEQNGYTWNDIVYIGSYELAIPIDNFVEIAKKTDYDSGYGAAEIAEDLMIIMNDDCWYDRGEYDGSEWWEYHSPVQVPAVPIVHIDRLKACGIGWESLREIYERGSENQDIDFKNTEEDLW